jgi:hypothetical protein
VSPSAVTNTELIDALMEASRYRSSPPPMSASGVVPCVYWAVDVPTKLLDDLQAINLQQRHGGVAADLGVVVNFPQHGHRGPENIVLD